MSSRSACVGAHTPGTSTRPYTGPHARDEEAGTPGEDLPCLRAALQLAQEVGAELEIGHVLQRPLPFAGEGDEARLRLE